jgi:hypothetical protein
MKWELFPLTLFLIFGIKCQRAQLNVYDDFETPKLSKVWTANRMEMHSFEIQSKIVWKGKSASKITLRTGDVVEAASGKDKASERDELMENSSLFSLEGLKYEYQFSMFLPENEIINYKGITSYPESC